MLEARDYTSRWSTSEPVTDKTVTDETLGQYSAWADLAVEEAREGIRLQMELMRTYRAK